MLVKAQKVLLALLLVCGLCPASAFADTVAEGSKGSADFVPNEALGSSSSIELAGSTESKKDVTPAYVEFGNPLTGGSGVLSAIELGDVSLLSEQTIPEEDHVTSEEAVSAIKVGMTDRQEEIVVSVKTDAGYEDLALEMFYLAFEEDEESSHGDYLRWVWDDMACGMKGYAVDHSYYITYSYSVDYKTTAAQEAELAVEVEKVLGNLALDGKGEYEKAKAIYDYICDTVAYDYTNLNDESHRLKYTAYAALMEKTAVCQGYSSLFYLMAREMGLSCRIIAGTGNGGDHSWNIVKIGDYFYNLDATWDAGKTEYDYFLKSDDDFTGHIRGASGPVKDDEGNVIGYMLEYESDEFMVAHPMAEASYGWDSIADSSITVFLSVTTYVYDGEAKKPSVTVRRSGTTLEEGVDYEVTYASDCVSPGTHTATITGKGNYIGEVALEFEVLPAEAKRLSGSDRYATMGAIVSEGFADDSCEWAVIATGAAFPDALSASALAGALGAPIILTNPSHLSGEAAAEIERIGAKRVLVVGGTSAVSDEVVSQLRWTGSVESVERVSGASRYETSHAIYEKGLQLGIDWSDTAVITTGSNFADALSISPYAYATVSPIFLSDPNSGLSGNALSAIGSGGFDEAVILGGTAAVPGSVERGLLRIGLGVERLSGLDRYETSLKIADWAMAGGRLDALSVAFATGAGFPDALAGGALCGSSKSVLLLVNDASTASAAARLVAGSADTLRVYVLGGTAVMPETVVSTIEGILF